MPPVSDHSGPKLPPDTSPEAGTTPHRGVFLRMGEIWTLSLDGPPIALKDIKGLRYIQQLLQQPGQEFHVIDILREPASPDALPDRADTASVLASATVSVGGLGDSGEMLDARAKDEYRRRLRELREELEEHRARGNYERAEALENEIDFISREISRAVGLGRRDRRAGSAAERARLNVTRAIKTALQKIAEHDRRLSELLEDRLRTGMFCRYVLDPNAPIDWRFSNDDLSPVRAPARPEIGFIPTGAPDLLSSVEEKTAFVGREAEREALRRVLEQVRSGSGRVVMIAGAPGVGKTRIAAEFAREAAQQEALVFAGACYDRDDAVPFVPFVEIFEAALAHSDPQAFRDALGDEASEIARLIPQLTRTFPDVGTPTELPPEQTRRALLGAVARVVGRISGGRALVLLLDDLHWADEGTLSMLTHLARTAAQIPLMMIGTYRDTELDLGGPLARTLDELARMRRLTQIGLGGLPEPAVAAMIQALSGREAPASLVGLIASNTEGNPFFVEELVRHLIERGKLLDSRGDFRDDLTINYLDVPQSVLMVIGRRLARLTSEALRILSTAAVIGRSFTFQLLSSAAKADPDSLIDGIEEAESAGLISSTFEYPEARFRFPHELIRQTVISRISAARRQRLHLDVAEAMESLNPDALEDVAHELAYHLQHAGGYADAGKTIRYLSMAAKRARLQGALTEAGELYRNALEALKRIPETPERDRKELGLQLRIGAVLMATRGYTYSETAAAYRRATTLGERLGDPVQVVLALTGLASQPLLRGELDTTQALADQILEVSKRDSKSRTKVWGCYIQGVVKYHRGHLKEAWDHLERALAEYKEEEHSWNPQDPGSETLEYMALTAWHMGMADTASARIRDAIILNRRFQKPYASAHCNFYAAYLHALLRDPAAAQGYAEQAIKLGSEHSIPLYLETGRIVYGWAIAQQGRPTEGAACARAAVKAFRAAGNRLALGSFLGFLAEALFSAGEFDEAVAAVEEGLRLDHPEPTEIPYLWWLRGKFLLEGTRRADAGGNQPGGAREDAEASFREALSGAVKIGAHSYAIRSATSLSELLASSGRRGEARATLQPLVNTVTQGEHTPETRDARKLLGELMEG